MLNAYLRKMSSLFGHCSETYLQNPNFIFKHISIMSSFNNKSGRERHCCISSPQLILLPLHIHLHHLGTEHIPLHQNPQLFLLSLSYIYTHTHVLYAYIYLYMYMYMYSISCIILFFSNPFNPFFFLIKRAFLNLQTCLLLE